MNLGMHLVCLEVVFGLDAIEFQYAEPCAIRAGRAILTTCTIVQSRSSMHACMRSTMYNDMHRQVVVDWASAQSEFE